MNGLFGLGPQVIRAGIKIGNWLFVGLKDTLMKLFVGAGAFAASIGRGIADWLNDETPFGDHVSLGPFGGFTIPKLAMGGTITAGGYALVGEQGPEVVRGGVAQEVRQAAGQGQAGSVIAEAHDRVRWLDTARTPEGASAYHVGGH
jgi:hypothetical protein